MQPTPNIEGLTDSTAAANPFVGLRPFESKEALLFFGRDDQTKELMHQLHQTRFLAVVGGSGSGKSSLIRAGLIPKLKAGFLLNDRGRWRVAEMKPGQAPLQNLAAALLSAFETQAGDEALRRLTDEIEVAGADAVADYLAAGLEGADANVLLLVDQFEEIFRFGSFSDSPDPSEDPAERDDRRAEAVDFVSILLELTRRTELPVYVVLTMRSDFLGDCDVFPGLPESMNRSQYLVPRLTHAQRLEAIQCPVRLRRMELEPELTVRVLGDIGEDPDQLPIMQHAMMRTWEKFLKSGGGAVRVEHYEAAGTIKEALSRDAEAALRSLDEGKRLVAGRMFQALVETDAQGRRLRRPAKLSDLVEVTGADRETILDIVRRFRDDNRSFLTVSDDRLGGDSLIDISHESLIRQWGTLSRWAEAEAESRELYLRLAADAVRYQKKLVPLWSDPALQLALDWWKERRPNEAWARRYHREFKLAEGFLNLSEKKRADDEAEAARLRDEQARREREEYEAAQRLAEEQRRRAEEVAEARRLQLVAANEAAAQQKKAAESARELAAQQEELARVRQSELEVANQLTEQQRKAARRQRRFMLVFAALFILMLALSAYALSAQKRAERSETLIKSSLVEKEKLTKSLNDELTARKAAENQVKEEKEEADRQRDIARDKAQEAEANARTAKENADRAEANARTAENALREANEAKQELVKKNELLNEQIAKLDTALKAAADYRNASKARRASDDATARGRYQLALSGYEKVGDRTAQADTHAELGHLLLRWSGPVADAEQEGEAARPQESRLDVSTAGTYGPDIARIITEGRGEAPEVEPTKVSEFERALLKEFGLNLENLRGLYRYRKALEIYRELKEPSTAAGVMEEVGEYFSESRENYSTKDDDKSIRQSMGRQAAISLFCAAQQEFKQAGNEERRITVLLKIGKRLDIAGHAPQAVTGDGTAAPDGRYQPGYSLALEGCKEIGYTPSDYFDEAMKSYATLVAETARTPQPERNLKLREAMASNALSVAQIYYEALWNEEEKHYLSWAERAYDGVGETPPERAPRSALFVRLGGILLGKIEKDAAAEYFDRALAAYPRADDAATRRELAFVLARIGRAYVLADSPSNAKKAQEFYARAEALYRPPVEDFKNEAAVLALIARDTRDSLKSQYYLKAADAYGKAGMKKQEADLLTKCADSLRPPTRSGVSNYPEEAIQHLQRAAKIYEGLENSEIALAVTHYNIGLSFYGLGRAAEAVESYKKALPPASWARDSDRLKRMGQIHQGLGRAQESLKLTADAAESYKQAFGLFVDAKDVNGGAQALEARRRLTNPQPLEAKPTPKPTPSPAAAPAQVAQQSQPPASFTVRARLSSPGGGDAPKGRAKYDVDDSARDLEIEFENVPADVALLVFIDGRQVAEIKEGHGGKPELDFESNKGQYVPQVGPRSSIVVKDRRGNIVVEGTFSAPSK